MTGYKLTLCTPYDRVAECRLSSLLFPNTLDLRPGSKQRIKIAEVLVSEPHFWNRPGLSAVHYFRRIADGGRYSWPYGDEGGRTSNGLDFVCDRNAVTEEEWTRFCDANNSLRCMYEDWLDVIVQTYPGGTLLDPACNNGYFLVGALKRGMSAATGYDRADYTRSVAFLNDLLGVNAVFRHRAYDSWKHMIKGSKRHDVVVASLILCHISDPLYFLAFLGRMAKEAIFLFTGMGVEPGYRIYYSKPNRFYKSDSFPSVLITMSVSQEFCCLRVLNSWGSRKSRFWPIKILGFRDRGMTTVTSRQYWQRVEDHRDDPLGEDEELTYSKFFLRAKPSDTELGTTGARPQFGNPIPKSPSVKI